MVKKEYDQGITLEEMADKLFVSEEYLSSQFKKEKMCIRDSFEGELDGNNQVIHGLRASLFDSISGTSSKKAVVKNLRVQNVFVLSLIHILDH